MPINDANRLALSNQLPYSLAAKKPSGRPTTIAKNIAASASSTVAGKRCLSSYVIALADAMLVPKLPCTVVSRYRQYCSYTGLSRPYWWFTRATCSGVECSPSSASAGEPGRA